MKYLNIFMLVCFLLLTAACEKDLPRFDDEECFLNFDYGRDLTTEEVTALMSFGSYSFILNSGEGQHIDTVWLKVNTMGKLSADGRPLALEQVMIADTSNAVAGIHYIAFDDPSLQNLYRIPANQAEVRIPVVVIRDSSLKTEGDVILKITFKDNGYFKVGYPEFSTYTLTISDRLVRPSAWDNAYLDSYFGVYGPQKHELMIKWSEKAWDNAYIESLFYDKYGIGFLYPKDEAYINYLTNWFVERLAEENAERLAKHEDIWREANGDPVEF